MLEDFFYGDLNMLGGPFHNWGFYRFYVINIPMIIALQYYQFGDIWRYNYNDATHLNPTALYGMQQQLPIYWREVSVEVPEHHVYFNLCNFVFYFYQASANVTWY